jgi:hypothetical protein
VPNSEFSLRGGLPSSGSRTCASDLAPLLADWPMISFPLAHRLNRPLREALHALNQGPTMTYSRELRLLGSLEAHERISRACSGFSDPICRILQLAYNLV